MAYDTRQTQGQQLLQNDPLAILYNTNTGRARSNYNLSTGDLQNYLNYMADNYPSFKATMQSEGMMNADGTIDAAKFMDSNYLQAIRNRAAESENTALQGMLNQANTNQALTGTRGSNIQTAGIGNSMNSMARNLGRQYADLYKNEKDTATNLAMNLGQSAQTDALNAMIAKQNALQNQVNLDTTTMNSEQRGILQDPQAMAAIAGALITGNPMGAVSALSGKLGGSAQQVEGQTGSRDSSQILNNFIRPEGMTGLTPRANVGNVTQPDYTQGQSDYVRWQQANPGKSYEQYLTQRMSGTTQPYSNNYLPPTWYVNGQ